MFAPVVRSLDGLLGSVYVRQVCQATSFLHGMNPDETFGIATAPVDFFPPDYALELESLLPMIGKEVIPPISETIIGAPTNSFKAATATGRAPVGGKGYYRLGENGRLYFTAKCEHYHTPLGHNFPGFGLIDAARDLGIVNATHNNTRGYVTRLLERELIRAANGIDAGNDAALEAVLASDAPGVLNRVINLETGSLAVEAGFKMMLARFYRLEETFPAPKYSGKIPVFFVMADDFGGSVANYHGTTVLVQTMRGLWPELGAKLDAADLMKVVPVRINDIDDFAAKVKEFNSGQFKVAGFLHEIVLMNYGGTLLSTDYLHRAYELCHAADIPVMVDEIQSCMWYPGLYLFRQYGLKPDFVIIGKGFSGGEYPASKILTTAEMDNLNQFGALVTNGQEELASLAYLITMEFVLQNGKKIHELGECYENGLRRLAEEYPALIEKIEGIGHLAGIHFKDANQASVFAKTLNEDGIDASAHGYKAKSLPAVLTKMPLISSLRVIEFILNKMRTVLEGMK